MDARVRVKRTRRFLTTIVPLDGARREGNEIGNGAWDLLLEEPDGDIALIGLDGGAELAIAGDVHGRCGSVGMKCHGDVSVGLRSADSSRNAPPRADVGAAFSRPGLSRPRSPPMPSRERKTPTSGSFRRSRTARRYDPVT